MATKPEQTFRALTNTCKLVPSGPKLGKTAEIVGIVRHATRAEIGMANHKLY